MKMPKIEFNAERFYRTGKYLFFIVGIANVIRILDMWTTYEAYDIVSSVASTLFQFVLFLFFSHLQRKETVKELNDGDIFKMNEALEKLNLEDNNGKKK